MMLTRDDILTADDLPGETVAVPEWGGDVLVRSMSGLERDTFEASLMANMGADKKVNMRNMRARLASLCMVGENQERLFADDEVDKLGQKSAKALDRVFAVAQRLNGLGDDDVEALTEN